MAALTATRDVDRKDGLLLALPVQNGETIYKGSTVVVDTDGYAQTNDGTTVTLANGDIFVGIATETADNSAGADGDVDVVVQTSGHFVLPFSDTLTQASVGSLVYLNNAQDDAAVTVTSDTGQPQCTIGTIVEFISANSARVRIDNYFGNIAAAGA